MDRTESAPESFEASRSKRDSLRVTVDTDDGQASEALKCTLGVTAHPQGGVHQDCSGGPNRGCEHVEALGKEDGDMALGSGATEAGLVGRASGAQRIAHRVQCMRHATPPCRSS